MIFIHGVDGIRKRWLDDLLRQALRVMPVVVVTGARQVGKTTLAGVLQPGRRTMTLDDLGVLGQARKDPDSLLVDAPVTIDEVQRAPELLLAVKRQVDRKRVKGAYLLTGSANLSLLAAAADSLAGRAVYLGLAPFCPLEWTGASSRLELLDRLFEESFDPLEWPDVPGDWERWLIRGGFPPALEVEEDSDRALWFSGYVQTYLERDLRQLSSVSSLPDFQRLLMVAANRTARVVNQSDIGRDAGLSQATAHRYLNLVEAGCLCTRLPAFASNPAGGVVKSPKLLWNDCGLAAWLAGIRDVQSLRARPDVGFWLEQALYQTLQTWCSLDPSTRRIHFWRDRSGREVDFILEKDGALVALEVKASGTVTVSDAVGLDAFRENLGRRFSLRRSVLLNARTNRPLSGGAVALPWGWMFPPIPPGSLESEGSQAGSGSR